MTYLIIGLSRASRDPGLSRSGATSSLDAAPRRQRGAEFPFPCVPPWRLFPYDRSERGRLLHNWLIGAVVFATVAPPSCL